MKFSQPINMHSTNANYGAGNALDIEIEMIEPLYLPHDSLIEEMN
jgi:hypothetical protein